jgi:hypothetical protein
MHTIYADANILQLIKRALEEKEAEEGQSAISRSQSAILVISFGQLAILSTAAHRHLAPIGKEFPRCSLGSTQFVWENVNPVWKKPNKPDRD